jgi:hypothetical protein
MQFQDAKLQEIYEKNRDCMQSLDESQREVCGVLSAYDWCRRVDGEESPRVQEALEALLSAELRPALREWYRRCRDDMNPAALEFRERFSKLAGERFG